jgi:hypothetical protein
VRYAEEVTRRSLFATLAAAIAGRKLLAVAAPDEALAAAQALHPMFSVTYEPKYSIGWACKYDVLDSDAAYMDAVCERVRAERERLETDICRQIFAQPSAARNSIS